VALVAVARRITFPELITPRQFQDATGLPKSLVRCIFQRVPRYPTPTNRIVVRRADLDRVLRDDPPTKLSQER
jgi:hypothetical protein